MNQYLIPANSKKSQLIFSLFRGIDLAILLVGAVITLFLMLLVDDDNIWMMVVKLLPVGVSLILVVPVPYYHNVLVFLQEVIIYLRSEKQYYWRGWCASYGFEEKDKSRVTKVR